MKSMNIEEKFENYLSNILPGTKSGYKYMQPQLFLRFVDDLKTPEDVEQMKDVVSNILGHRNRIGSKNMDKFLEKGLTIAPLSMLDFIKYHRELLYYPHPDTLDLYVDYFTKQENYEENAKVLIEKTLKEYWLK